MTFIVDGTNGLTFPNSTTQNSGGQVLQVVSATSSAAFATSSGSFVSTGFSASITPKFSTSKILVFCSVRDIYSPANMYANMTMYRNSTAIDSTGMAGLYLSGTNPIAPASLVCQDSPATTSSTTYTLYFRNQNNNGTVTLNANTGLCSLILMEIAG